MKKFILLLTCIFSFTNAFSQTESRKFIPDSLDAYVEEALAKWKIPGAAILIVKDGKIVLVKGYGVREIGKDDKVNENTLFMIGSNTKAFTGTALALLENDGKISLDDKVIKYLPDFSMNDPWVTKELNLVDIVSHRMGMETFQGDFMYWTSDLTSDEVIEKFGMLTPVYGFREKWGYTNAGYAVAGKIIEKITGKSWSSFIDERIFTQLGMNRTTALAEEYRKADNIAVPHTLIDNEVKPIPVPAIDNLAPAGSIGSSVIDLSKWILAQLNMGKLNDEQVIPESVIKKTREPASITGRTSHPFNKSHFNLYALGWQLKDYEGRELIEHTGGVNGFVTSVTLVPEENLGVVILTNSDQNSFYIAAKWEIIDAYLNLPFRDYSNRYYKNFSSRMEKEEKRNDELRDSVKMNLPTELPFDEYTGKYVNDVYGYINIGRDNELLKMNFEHHSKLEAKLESLGGNRFLCTFNDPIYGVRTINFTTEGKEVKKFNFGVHPFIEITTYDFVKQ